MIGEDGTVYVSAGSGIYAFASVRTLKWRRSLTYSAAPCGMALASDGTVRWEIDGIASEGAPAIGADGTLYVASGCNYSPKINARGYVVAIAGSAPFGPVGVAPAKTRQPQHRQLRRWDIRARLRAEHN